MCGEGWARGSLSLIESLHEPPRSNHLRAEGLSPLPQLAIRGDQRDLIRRIRGHVDERVVTAVSGMDDRHAVDIARLDPIAGLPFQDHHHRSDEPARFQGCAHLIDERSGRSSSVPPPAGRTRPHDVGGIDEKHCSSLIAASGEVLLRLALLRLDRKRETEMRAPTKDTAVEVPQLRIFRRFPTGGLFTLQRTG
jgi:hypothetical protein